MAAAVLLGEWWQSNAMFGGVYFCVAIFIFGLAWYILRGDRLNRVGMDEEPPALGQGETDEADDRTSSSTH